MFVHYRGEYKEHRGAAARVLSQIMNGIGLNIPIINKQLFDSFDLERKVTSALMTRLRNNLLRHLKRQTQLQHKSGLATYNEAQLCGVRKTART